MLLSQRPLSAAATDAPLAIRRRADLAEKISRNVGRGRNTLILGPRGSGRTTLLSLVANALRAGSADRLRLVDAGAWARTEDLVAAILAALDADPRGSSTRTVTWQERQGLAAFGDVEVTVPRPVNETDASRIVRAATTAAGTDGRLVVLIDNLRPGPAHDLFGRFRDTLWAAPVAWVAAGDGDRDGYLDPPADVFWEAVEWLEPLDRGGVVELLQLRIDAAGDDDPDAGAVAGALDRLADMLDGSTPREVVRAAAQVADQGDVEGAFGTSQRFGRAHAAGGRSAAMLLAEMERIGRPVHAGDEELLARMGVSRPRIVQLLRRLEEARLVEGHREGRRIQYQAVP